MKGWENEVLNDTVLSQGIIKHAAIVTFPKGQVKAKNFDIDKKGDKYYGTGWFSTNNTAWMTL